MKECPRRIAVLLAAYNGKDYLLEQLRTILGQVEVQCDIYISLDKSTDESYQLLLDLAERHENIKLLSYGETYGSAGQNFFRLIKEVDFSGYDYVAFADQDDIWLKDKLSSAVTMLNSRGYDGYSSNVTAFWEDGREKMIVKSSPQSQFDFLFESAGPGCTFVMTRRLALDIKQFLNNIGEKITDIWLHDWFCYAFARARGYSWIIDSKSYMQYRQHSANSVGANSGLDSLLKRINSVMSGDAFDKVIKQASVLGIDRLKPIQLIQCGSFRSSAKLLSLANQCRRNKKDKVLFFMAVLCSTVGRSNQCRD
ncbi:glycosyltransferase [Shewanella submarina]|uniref:Glycosyltransferase n=1 Tax=Shewanella submarina TaxID=2016376 RepID=A0ABV7GL29_9GAMM|nr:glycosyltransferase [Shewanella submarina]MCL1036547.1 glycosyltransferase [Shewanella submarina]